jgi:hypothetical protein
MAGYDCVGEYDKFMNNPANKTSIEKIREIEEKYNISFKDKTSFLNIPQSQMVPFTSEMQSLGALPQYGSYKKFTEKQIEHCER